MYSVGIFTAFWKNKIYSIGVLFTSFSNVSENFEVFEMF